MMVASEATSKPKRFATGVVLEDDDEGGFIADQGFQVDDPTDAELWIIRA